MKMLKKLLAVVLTGAMALTLLTACGSKAVSSIAVSDKDIADAMSDLAKTQNEDVTFTPRAEEREIARKLAPLLESGNMNDYKMQQILGYDQGGVNENNFVWVNTVFTDELGTSGQAYRLMNSVLAPSWAKNSSNLIGKMPADIRYMGTALCKGTDKNGNLVTMRLIVVTAPVKGQEPQHPGKA